MTLLLSLCRSATLVAITVPLAFCHGPLPMRSRALTGPPCAPWLVLRYARQVLPPAPTACASCWQCASAPARPPKSAPLPGPALVMKNVMLFCCACPLPFKDRAISAAEASTPKRIDLFICKSSTRDWLARCEPLSGSVAKRYRRGATLSRHAFVATCLCCDMPLLRHAFVATCLCFRKSSTP